MNTINGTAGYYVYEMTLPEEIIFAYSRHVYFKATLTANGRPVQGKMIEMQVMNNVTSEYHTETRYTDGEGNVTFDVARLLQVMTGGREKEMNDLMYDANDYALWNMKSFSFTMSIMESDHRLLLNTLFPEYVVVNGRHDNARDWWSEERRLKWWVNYPFTYDQKDTDLVTIMQGAGGKNIEVHKMSDNALQLVRFNPAPYDDGKSPTMTIRLRRSDGFSIVDGQMTTRQFNPVHLDIDRCERNDRKTYLRWLGTHGEVFYWLFDNITEDIAVKSDTYARTMTDDTFRGLVTNRMRDNGIIKDSTTTRTRTIATDFLDKDYFELVASIAESPCVDMLIGTEDNEKWQRVLVADGSFSRSLKVADRAKRNRISLTIEMPEI